MLDHPGPDTLVYCCRPEALLAAVEARCAGWPTDSLRVERPAARSVAERALSGAFEIVLQYSGMTLVVPPDKPILRVVEEVGVDVLTSCEEGSCGTGGTTVLEGIPDDRDSVLSERDAKRSTA